MSSAAYTGFERGGSPVKFAALRGRSAETRLGAARQEFLGLVGSGAEIPVDREWVRAGERRDRLGVPVGVVSACRSSIVEAGRPYGMIWVDAASAGRLRVNRTGAAVAPIEARAAYQHAAAVQTRHARLICRLSPEGKVVALR